MLLYDGAKDDMKSRRRDSLLRREDEIQKQHDKARLKKLDEERMAVRKQVGLFLCKMTYISFFKLYF